MIQARDVDWMEIERAKNFIRTPFTEGFRAWSTLRDRDNVTMTIHELGHLMAWYAEIRAEEKAGKEKSMNLEDGKPLGLPREVKHG